MSRMLAVLVLLLPLLMFACGPSLGDDDDSSASDDDDSVAGDDDDSTPADDDDDDSTPADDDDSTSAALVEIVSVYPESGATEVFVGTSIVVDFSGPTQATPSLSGPGDVAVPFATSWVSTTRMVVTPAESLDYSTTYDASVTWTDGTDDMEFTTSDVGSVPVNQDLTGTTYAWNIGSGNVISPEGDELLLGAAGDFVLLTGVTAQSANNLGLIGGLADTSGAVLAQDLCIPTAELSEAEGFVGDDDDSAGDDDDSAGDDDDSAGDDDDSAAGDLPPGNWNDPAFVAGPANLLQRVPNPLTGAAMELTLYDATFGGTFVASSAGSPPGSIAGGSFSAYVDLRDAAMGFSCVQIAQFAAGIDCIACAHDPAAQECVQLWVIDVTAELVPGVTMVPRSQETIDADSANCP